MRVRRPSPCFPRTKPFAVGLGNNAQDEWACCSPSQKWHCLLRKMPPWGSVTDPHWHSPTSAPSPCHPPTTRATRPLLGWGEGAVADTAFVLRPDCKKGTWYPTEHRSGAPPRPFSCSKVGTSKNQGPKGRWLNWKGVAKRKVKPVWNAVQERRGTRERTGLKIKRKETVEGRWDGQGGIN